MEKFLKPASPFSITGWSIDTLDGVGRVDEGMALNEECLERSIRVRGEVHPDTLLVMMTIAMEYRRKGQFDECVRRATEVLRFSEEVLGKGQGPGQRGEKRLDGGLEHRGDAQHVHAPLEAEACVLAEAGETALQPSTLGVCLDLEAGRTASVVVIEGGFDLGLGRSARASLDFCDDPAGRKASEC